MPMSYIDTPVGFHRVYKAPLDDHEIFTSNDDLINYCKNGAAYSGQHVAVVYDNFTQECILKASSTDNKIYPVILLNSGNELVTKQHNGLTYALIYYFNAVDTEAVSTFNTLTSPRLSSWRSFSIMNMSQLLSFKLKTENQYYLLEYVNPSNDTTGSGDFSQVDPIYGSVSAVSRNNSAVTKMWKSDNSATDAFIYTDNSNINLLHKSMPTKGTIYRLWVLLNTNAKVCYFGR